MRLNLEKLEDRILLAAPIKPFDLDLLAAGDSGDSDTDDVTKLNNGTLELIAETNSTIAIYNAGYIGDATGQNDTLFYESGGVVTIEAEKGTIGGVPGAMIVNNVQGGFEGTGYIDEINATWDHPENGGTVTYSFYITTEDDYYIHSRCYFSDANTENSLFVNIDDTWQLGETGPSIWSNTINSWHFSTATNVVNEAVDKTWHLTVGWHEMEIHGREPSRIDRFAISNNAAAPVDPGAAQSITYETFQYTFTAGELIGSAYGTANSITATAENIDGTSAASDALAVTYDNNTVTPALPDMTPSSDTGNSNTDNLTNDTTATFTGAAGSVEVDSTVWLRIGGANTRSATAGADGSWSITVLNGDLNEGANILDIIYIDIAGNTSGDSANLTVNLDTTANAAAAAPDLDAGSDTGLSNSDDYTNDTTTTFTGGVGAVEGSSTVWLRIGGVNTRSATAAANGSYTVTLEEGDLSEGNNTIDIVYIDQADNTSTDSANLTVELDTVSDKPAAPDLTSNVANDTGSSQIDNITSENNCEISGTAEDNGTVHIYVNGTEVNTTASNGAGAWSYTFLNGNLTEGLNTITVTVEDSLSNSESANSNSLVITLDTIMVETGTPDLRAASDSGDNSDNITNDNAAWFDGYAEPGTTVQLFVEAAGKGTDTADSASGAWSIQLNNGDLAVGTNDITAQATDAAGNTATSPALTVTYDDIGVDPTAAKLSAASDSGTSNTDGITNIATATVYGSVDDGNEVEAGATVQVWSDNGGWTQVGTTTADAIGNWSYALDGVDDLAEGANLVRIRIVDLAGNTSASYSPTLSITLDTAATVAAAQPDLSAGSDTGDSNADNHTNDTTTTFSGGAGAVEGNAIVWLRVDAVNTRSTTAAANGSYTITMEDGDLAAGDNIYAIDIVYIDPAGNAAGDSTNLAVRLDTVANVPTVPDLNNGNDTGSSATDNITSDKTGQITSTAEADSTVHIRLNSVQVNTVAANGAGNWSYNFLNGDLTEGLNIVDVFYVDAAGNTSTDSANLTITLDTVMATPATPDLRTASDTGNNSDNITSDDAAWFDGYAEPGATVQIFAGAVGKGTDTADAATGAWSIQLNNDDLANGNNDITVTTTDTSGNSATSPALVVTFDPDGTAPDAPKLLSTSDSGILANDRITNIDAAVVYGSVGAGNEVEGGATVHVRTNKNGGGWVEIGTTTSDGNGNWSYAFDGVDDIEEGSNLVEIFITDLSLNDSACSADLTITLDQTAADPTAGPDLDAGSDTGSDNSDNITSDTTPTFTGIAGTVEDDSAVWLRIDGSNIRSTTAAGDGSWSLTLLDGDMTAGTHSVDIVYIDVAGNTSGNSANMTVTLDTTTAAPAAEPDLTSSSDSGSSNTDNLTNDTTATFTGPANTVETDATVWLRIDGADTHSTTADTDGSYSITLLNGDLTEGLGSVIDIYYIDTAGNTSTDSANLTVNLDTTIAAPAKPDLTDSSDTGTSNSDNVTAETRPTIQGTAGTVENNSTVYIWLDTPSGADTEIDSVTAGADGSWSYTFTSAAPLEEGINQIHIVALDPAGNTSVDSADLTVTINFDTGAEAAPDLVAASDSGSANDDNITNDSTATISGTCPAGAVVKVRINGGNIAQFTDNDATDQDGAAGQWIYTFPPGVMVEGVNTIDFLTIDTDKNTTDWSLDLVITLDTTIENPTQPNLTTPDDSGSSSGDDITNVTTPTITGTAEAGSAVTIDINAGTHTANETTGADGTWSYTITNGWLNEGANTIATTATDIAGNSQANAANLVIHLDTTVNIPATPDLTAATDTGSDSTDNITTHSNPRIIGTADANTTITVRLDPNGAVTAVGTTTADGGGGWSFTFPGDALAEGDNEIDVLSTDIAGNSSNSAELTITMETTISIPDSLDLTAASDLGDDNTDDITSLATATFTGSADANCTINVRVNGTVIGNTTSNGVGNWSYTFDGVDDLIEGTNIIDAYAQDDSGNLSDYSADLIITLDTVISTPTTPDLNAASDSGTSSTDNYTNDTGAVINGYCEDGATVTINLNGADIDTVTDIDTNGLWSYTFAGGLNGSAGGTDNLIKIAQVDVAGNASGYSTVLTITLDNTSNVPATVDLIAGCDTGDADDDNLTNLSNITITGATEINSSLQLYVNQGAGPALIDTISEHLLSSGTFTYTFSTGQLAEGNNEITVVATDKAGNVSASSPALTVVLDQTVTQPGLPDLAEESDTGESDHDEVTSDETPTFTGQADPDCHITIRIDGEPINTVDADAAGNWPYTFDQGEIQTGVRLVDVVATDPAGNISQPSDDLTIWLNIAPTQPAAPNLQSGSDSGSINTDNRTYISQGIIDGKADAYRDVEVYVDTNLRGATTADADGFWQYTFGPGNLSEGNNEITIITEDSSGLRSTVSCPLVITLDTTAPEAPLPDLQPGSDTGTSDSDNLTSDRTATIGGETEPSALIDLYHNENFTTRLTATIAGNWSYTFAPDDLIEGENEIYVVITDVAGNVSLPSETLTVVLDIQQDDPDVPNMTEDTDTGTSNSDNLTNNSTSEILGTVKPDSSVEIFVSGQSVSTVEADDNGQWQYNFESGILKEGLNFIEVESTDPVGNTARSATLELALDTTPPVVYNYFPKGTYNLTSQTIELYIHGNDLDTIAAGDTGGYTLLGSGGDGTFDDGNEWTIPISGVMVESVSGLVQLTTAAVLSDDTYQFTIDPNLSLHDEAGNQAQLNLAANFGQDFLCDSGTIMFTFEIDTAGPPAPQSPQIDPAYDSGIDQTDNITNIARALIHIDAEPEVSVEVICNGLSAGFANETQPGQYQLFLDATLIREGENLLLARAFDALGNSSDLSELQTVVYDSQGPQVTAIVVDSLWYDQGPRQISVVLNEVNIDADSVLETDNYLLMAAGGDGTFQDGNETIISLAGAYYNSETQSIILTMPQTVTGSSELGPDDYQLTIPADSSVSDAAGNTLNQDAVKTFTVVQTEIIYSNESYRYTTSAGQTVTVILLGPGQARVLPGESAGTDNTIEQIVLKETTESSMLLVSAAGNGTSMTIGRILCDTPMRTLMARQSQITEQVTFQQSIGSLWLGAIGQNAQITLTEAESINIMQGDLAGQTDIIEGGLNRLALYQGDLTGPLTVAEGIGQIQILRGAIEADITAEAVGTIYTNEINGATIRATQGIDSILARSGTASSISAGTDIRQVRFLQNITESTISAGQNLGSLFISGDALDNLFLSGADLGRDGRPDGIADTFSDGNIDMLFVGGSYAGTITAAAVNPGSDLKYFTADDSSGLTGDISRVIFGRNSLSDITGTEPFGLMAGGTIPPFYLNGQLVQAPYQLGLFQIFTIT